MERSDPMVDASLPDMRARSRPGTAIDAMMPMIATTISSSTRVKPPASCAFILDPPRVYRFFAEGRFRPVISGVGMQDQRPHARQGSPRARQDSEPLATSRRRVAARPEE